VSAQRWRQFHAYRSQSLKLLGGGRFLVDLMLSVVNSSGDVDAMKELWLQNRWRQKYEIMVS